MTNYEETQKELVQKLIATQSVECDDPFKTYYERVNEFESFLSGPDGLPNCGCGNPDDTLLAFMEALDYCALRNRDFEKRKAFLSEKFGVEYASDDRLVQLVFYVLDEKGYIEHNYTIDGSFLTDAGKVFRALLNQYINEPSVEQIANGDFDIDFDAVLAADLPDSE